MTRPANLSEILKQIVSGDLSNLSTLLTSHHSAVLDSTKQIPRLCLEKPAVLRVLLALRQGHVSHSQVQEWASFVRRGYVALASRGSVQPVAIDYDETAEPVIAEIIARLDEIGDEIDGTISDAETLKMVELLQE